MFAKEVDLLSLLVCGCSLFYYALFFAGSFILLFSLSKASAGTAMVKHFLAGCVGGLNIVNLVLICYAGLVGVVIGHPFDTIRVRLQTQSTGLYKSVLDCFMKIVKLEGVSILEHF